MKSILLSTVFVAMGLFLIDRASASGVAPDSPQQGQVDCESARSEIKACAKRAKAIKDACQDQSDTAVDQIFGANKAAGATGQVAQDAGNKAQAVADKCLDAFNKCDETCGNAIKAAEQCKKPEQQQQAKKEGEKQKNYCEKEGKPRAEEAQKQADAQKAQQQDAKQNGEKNQGQGGGSPPPPPQKPEEDKKANNDKKDCSLASNASAPECAKTATPVACGAVPTPGCVVTTPFANLGIGTPVTSDTALPAEAHSSSAEEYRGPATFAPDITDP